MAGSGGGGGGGRGGSYFPSNPSDLHDLMRKSREDTEKKLLEGDVNALLLGLLAEFNDRDVEKTNEHLDQLATALQDVEMEKLLLGGSVAKHTFIDGLSDVDALVVLPSESAGEGSTAALDRFVQLLRSRVDRSEIENIWRGDLAVTVRYRDGTEVQLLPALQSGRQIHVPDGKGGWNGTNPARFHRELTRANQRLNGGLVPAVKLFKSIVSNLPAQKKLSGYHIEALCVHAVKGYRGPKTVKAVLQHVVARSAELVRKPTPDSTGQSKAIDADLGSAKSVRRRAVSDSLAAISRQLNCASSLEQWERIVSPRT